MRRSSLCLVACLLVTLFAAPLGVRGDKWAKVRAVLVDEMQRHTYPGAAAAVLDRSGIIFQQALGNFTYGDAPPLTPFIPKMKIDTLFDMASMTKVLMTTTAFALLYQNGSLDLTTPLSDSALLGQAYAVNGKQAITSLNLLLHNAGFAPDPVPVEPSFGCPQVKISPPPQSFACQEAIYKAMMNLKPINPPGAVFLYSDLSMITGMYVIGTVAQNKGLVQPGDLRSDCAANLSPSNPAIAQCYFEAYVRKYITGPLALKSTGFMPPKSLWPTIPPEYYDNLRGVIQGAVSDSNAYAMGGISGHAGLYTNVPEVATLTSTLMWELRGESFVNATTWKYFTTVYNLTQSSRALGWDTNNYQMDVYRGCGNLSSTSWYHTGYTGTFACGDPEREIITILLTNRAYDAYPTSIQDMQRARQRFCNAVKDVVDAHRNSEQPPKPIISSNHHN